MSRKPAIWNRQKKQYPESGQCPLKIRTRQKEKSITRMELSVQAREINSVSLFMVALKTEDSISMVFKRVPLEKSNVFNFPHSEIEIIKVFVASVKEATISPSNALIFFLLIPD